MTDVDATATPVVLIADHDTQPSPVVETAVTALSQGSLSGTDLGSNDYVDEEKQGLVQPTDDPSAEDAVSRPLKDTNGRDRVSSLGNGDDDDSFIEQIKTRTPAKRISRIEDSVEALDALHEEIEKVDQAMPVPKPVSGSSSKTKAKLDRTASTHDEKAVKDRIKSQKQPNVSKKAVKTSKSSDKSVISRQSMQLGDVKGAKGEGLAQKAQASFDLAPSHAVSLKDRSTSHKRVSSLHNAPFQPTKSTKAPTRANFELPGDVVARKLKEQREDRVKRRESEVAPAMRRTSSANKAHFQPVKSTKAPTRANFELPGEAVSRKLKEQREARQKREEAEAVNSKTFKARPVRVSDAPTIRTTASSRARLSMAQATPTKAALPVDIGRKSLFGTSCRSTSMISNKRQSVMSTAGQPMASITKNPIEAAERVGGSRHSLVDGDSRSAPTAAHLAHQKSKGKEVFARPKMAIAEQERVRREKEAAAKKARIEAAERGRIASREWAEKQKARKLAEMADRGASVG